MYLVVGPFFEHIQTNIRNEYEYYEYKHIITHLAKAIDLIESSMYNVKVAQADKKYIYASEILKYVF